MSIQTTRTGHVLRAGTAFALAIAAAGGLATSSQAATATQAAMTPSSATGKEAGGQAVTATTTTNKFYSGKVNVQFQLTTTLAANCGTTFTTPVANSIINATSTAIISARKVNIVVPNLTASGGAGSTQYWQICAYNGSTAGTSTLLAKASYTSTAAPTLTVLGASGVSLPTYGGTSISVVGTNFVAPLTATLDGVALTNVNVVDTTLFTAEVPVHAAGAVPLTVTTIGGTATILSVPASGGAFTYVGALSVSPSTGVTGSSYTLDVQGVGFNNITWTTSTGLINQVDDTSAHIYLVKADDATVVTSFGHTTIKSAYDPFTAATNKATAEKNECHTIQIISDTELVCTLDLAKTQDGTINTALIATATPIGLYQVAFVANGAAKTTPVTAPYFPTAISSGAMFSVSPF